MARWPYNKGPFTPYDWARGPNRDTPQARGLVAWWPTLAARGVRVLRDLSGYNTHTSFAAGIASPTWASNAQRGSMLTFDGGDYAQSLTGVPPTTNFTLSAWLTPGAGVGTQTLISTRASGNTGWAFKARQYSANTHVGFSRTGVADYSSTIATPSTLSLLTLVIDSTNALFYLNGALISTVVIVDGSAATLAGYVLGTGHRNNALNTDYYIGSLSDLRVYNRVLSAAEVWQLYADPWALYPEPRMWAVAAPAGGSSIAAIAGYYRRRRTP